MGTAWQGMDAVEIRLGKLGSRYGWGTEEKRLEKSRSVKCPHCGVPGRKRCLTPGGGPARRSHVARLKSLERLMLKKTAKQEAKQRKAQARYEQKYGKWGGCQRCQRKNAPCDWCSGWVD